MIVDNNGFVGIGTLTPNYQLEVNTNSACKPTSSLWTISADERLKTIDGNYTKGLPELLQLNTIMYHYAPGNARNLPTANRDMAFRRKRYKSFFLKQ